LQKPANCKFSYTFSNKHLHRFPTKKSARFPRKNAGWPNYEGGRTPPALCCLRLAMLITKYIPPHAQTPSLPALSCLYNCRVRSTNTPYLKKQTQFPKKLNAPKLIHNNNLRPIGHLVTRDKANPNKPNLSPKTPAARAQNLPNLLPHNELRNHPPNPKTNPIPSDRKRSWFARDQPPRPLQRHRHP